MNKKILGFLTIIILIATAIPLSAKIFNINNPTTTSDLPVTEYKGIMFIRGDCNELIKTEYVNISFSEGDQISIFGFVYSYFDEVWAFISDQGTITIDSSYYASSFFGICRSGKVFGLMLGDIGFWAYY